MENNILSLKSRYFSAELEMKIVLLNLKGVFMTFSKDDQSHLGGSVVCDSLRDAKCHRQRFYDEQDEQGKKRLFLISLFTI